MYLVLIYCKKLLTFIHLFTLYLSVPVLIEKNNLMIGIHNLSETIINGDDADEGCDKEERRLMKKFQKYYEPTINRNMYQHVFDERWPKLKKHLFNIVEDPEEKIDLKEELPEILEKLRVKAREFYGSFIPRDYPKSSKEGNPKFYDGVWSSGWC